jgi:hypothetical protein
MDTEGVIRWIVTCARRGGSGSYYQPPPPAPSPSNPPKYLYVILKDGKGFVVPVQSYEEYMSLKDRVSRFSAFIHNILPAYRMPTAVTVVSAEELLNYLYSLYSPRGGSPPPPTGQTPPPSQPPSGGETSPSEPIQPVSTPRQLDATKVVLWGGIALGLLVLVVLLTRGKPWR